MQSSYSTQILCHSQYNYFVDRPEGMVGYNARTGTFAIFSKETGRILQDKGAIESLSAIDAKALLDMGFLHEGNEINLVVSKFEDLKKQQDTLSLTLLPTLSCNFSCDYCFQNEYRSHQFMSPDIQAATLDFIQKLILDGRRKVTCTWFGGEPLLAKKIILDMAQKINQLIYSENAQLIGSDIITNGILLNAVTAKELSEVGIKTAQISIDSLIFKTKTKRGLVDIDGNPSIILRNIMEARDFIKIRIRINVSVNNTNEIDEITRVLDSYGLTGTYGFGQVNDLEEESDYIVNSEGYRTPNSHSNGCSSCDSSVGEEKSLCLSRAAYAKVEQDKFLARPDSLQFVISKLEPKVHPCSATSGYLFVVDPAGYISRCWHSAGVPSESMGNVLDLMNSVEESDVAKQWRSFSPFAYPACRNCSVLPLCMGGCSHPRVFMEANKPPCEAIKQQVQFCVDTVGTTLEITPEQHSTISIKT